MIDSSADPVVPRPSPSVFAICPADIVSGGPELLHQLVHRLRSSGQDARIVYVPFGEHHQTPEPYRCYNVRIGALAEINPDSVVVVPEVFAWKLLRLPRCRIYVWWLSVDNFRLYAIKNRAGRLFPALIVQKAALALIRSRAAANLFQSEYARLFGAAHRLHPLLALSDCLSDPYIAAARLPRKLNRKNLVVYNPVKGADRTQLVLEALARISHAPIEAIPIEGMSRAEVLTILSRAKLYIDIGDHPGKDRLPREAAALGCCVLVNRRGSAANDQDIPIPRRYKLDDTKADFQMRAATMIIDICARFSEHAPRFDSYRAMIVSEPGIFASQVDRVFGTSRGDSAQATAATASEN